MTLKYTRDQVQAREFAQIQNGSRPNAWWAWAGGSDCMAAQAYLLGIRSNRASSTSWEISIAAFRDHFGWDEVPVDGAKAGMLLLEEWISDDHPKLVGIPTHIEWINTIDHAGGTVNICSGNTGPAPGVSNPNGFWRKNRPLNDHNFLAAIVVPYAGAADTSPYGAKPPTGLTKKDVKLVAAYLNSWSKQKHPNLHTSTASKDGISNEAPNYWTLVQTWGRDTGIYGPRYIIDGDPGPRSRQVEAVILKRAKAAATK